MNADSRGFFYKSAFIRVYPRPLRRGIKANAWAHDNMDPSVTKIAQEYPGHRAI